MWLSTSFPLNIGVCFFRMVSGIQCASLTTRSTTTQLKVHASHCTLCMIINSVTLLHSNQWIVPMNVYPFNKMERMAVIHLKLN